MLHLALIADYVYDSWDLAAWCLRQLADRAVIEASILGRYLIRNSWR